MLQIDETKIESEVYATSANKDVLYIKFTFPSLKLYINSFTVRPSPNYGGLWFQTPKFPVGRRWMEPIEFKKDSPFFEVLQDEAMRAADRYIHDHKLEMLFPGTLPADQDTVSQDDADQDVIDLSDVPF